MDVVKAGPYWTHSFIPDVTEVRIPPDAMQRMFSQMCFFMKRNGKCPSKKCFDTKEALVSKLKFVPLQMNFIISIN